VLRDAGYHTHAEATGPVVKQKDMHRGFDEFHHRDEGLYDPGYWSTVQERLAGMPADRPWLFYLHLWELHWPRSVPREFDHRRYGAHRYERALSALDRLKVPRLLELAGQDTLVVMTGDHGEVPRLDLAKKVARRLSWKAPKAWIDVRSGHGFGVIEDLVRVPLVLHGPGVPAAGRVGTAVRHVDLFPTVLELVGAAADPRASQGPGHSLVPLFTGGDGRPGSGVDMPSGEDRPGYSEAVGVKMGSAENWLVSLRHDGWKLVRRAAGDAPPVLWRLPDERTDVAAANPQVVARLEGLLEELLAGTSIDRTGEDLSAQESAEVEEHLRDLGYID
jgi:uncharacterized sulfatase